MSIKINIRTGTSTRKANPKKEENFIERLRSTNFDRFTSNFIEEDVKIELYEYIFPHPIFYDNISTNNFVNASTSLEDIISRSMIDSELKRNPSIQLDLNSFECEDKEIDKTCSICCTKFQKKEKLSKIEICQHIFHSKCIEEWGKYKAECPLCRQEIPILER